VARFEPTPPDVAVLLADIAKAHYPALAPARFELLFAWSETSLPAVEVKTTMPIYRAAGVADALVVLDASRWEHASKAERRATLDHALASVEIVAKASGVSTDSAGRPRLVRRSPDLAGIGFRDVWRRNPKASIEATRAKDLIEKSEQMLMFGERN
jgi:hypothetical protein